jgi:predicted NBD/HSP70 family sugar kinase
MAGCTQMTTSSIIRSDDLRSQNRSRLLSTLRLHGACTPAQLSHLTGLSAASVSTLSTQLIEQGMLLSQKHPETVNNTGRGRPKSQLSLNHDAGSTVTVYITIDHIQVQRINYAGDICESRGINLDSRALSTTDLLETTTKIINSVCSAEQKKQLLHIAVAFQGVTEHATGTLIWSPILHIKYVPLGAMLEQQFSVPISVENDCQLMSQALSQINQDQLGRSFATVLFSHGIGLGLYLDGQSFSGIRSSALELGHMQFERNGALCRCGKRGCIEAYAADYGIARMAMGQSIEDAPVGRVSEDALQDLVNWARDGDRASAQAFAIAGAAVADGLVNLFTLLDPMPVALIGHTNKAFDLMREGIESVFKQRLPEEFDAQNMLHFFNNEEKLIEFGLIQNSLCHVDAQFSDPNFEKLY